MKKTAEKSPFTRKSAISIEECETEDLRKFAHSDREITLTEAKKLLPKNLRHLELNPREYKFLAIYCSNNFDAENAVMEAGYQERTRAGYRAIAYSLLKREAITEGIRIFIDTIIQPYKDRLELELLNIYYRRATYNIKTFYNSKGSPLDLDEIDREWMCCIDDVKYIKVDSRQIISAYQLPNRDMALQALYRFITGSDMKNNPTLPDDAKRKVSAIYQTIIKSKNVAITPKNIRKMRTRTEDE